MQDFDLGMMGVQSGAVFVALCALLLRLAQLCLGDAQRVLQPLQLICLHTEDCVSACRIQPSKLYTASQQGDQACESSALCIYCSTRYLRTHAGPAEGTLAWATDELTP